MSDRQAAGAETIVAVDLEVKVVTNFQIISENGGFLLIFGTRRLQIPEGAFGAMPVRQVEAFAAAFLSHGMLKNLTQVMVGALNQFEKTFGVIPAPQNPQPPSSPDPEPLKVKPKTH